MTADVWLAVVTGWAIMTLIVGFVTWQESFVALRHRTPRRIDP